MAVNIHEAKTHFSKLLRRVAAGEEITIAKAGVPIAKLVPASTTKKRELGLYSGQIWIADDFDAPLPDDILAGFLGEEETSPPKVKKPAAAETKKPPVKNRKRKQ
jgi:prevent-host-death family protein